MIRLCIFDLGGTIIDKYSLSPFISLKNAFKNNGIDIHNSLIFKDMGKNKKEHVDLILCDNYVQKSWYLKHGRFPNKADSQLVYNEFNRYQLKGQAVTIFGDFVRGEYEVVSDSVNNKCDQAVEAYQHISKTNQKVVDK